MTKLITALMTPFLNQGEIDWKCFEKMLRQQEEAQNGVLLFGSTGEGANLDEEEKREMLQFAFNLQLNIPIMVGVGGINLRTTSSWIQFCNQFALQGFLLTVPPYARPGVEGLYGWFKALMDQSNHPCMLYNNPGRSAISLHNESLKRLLDHPRLWGVKDSSGSVKDYARYRNTLGASKVLYAGDDDMLAYFHPLSCQGLISPSSNIWPKEMRLYVELILQGKLTPEDLQLWNRAFHLVFSAANPVAGKAFLHHLGMISTPTLRLPLHQLDQHLAGESITAIHAEIREWGYQKGKIL